MDEHTWTARTSGQKITGRFVQYFPFNPNKGIMSGYVDDVNEKASGIYIYQESKGSFEWLPFGLLIAKDQALALQLSKKHPGPQARVRNWARSADGPASPKPGFETLRAPGKFGVHGISLGMTENEAFAALLAADFIPGLVMPGSSLESQVRRDTGESAMNDADWPWVSKYLESTRQEGDMAYRLRLDFAEDTTSSSPRVIVVKIESKLIANTLPVNQLQKMLLDALVEKFGQPTAPNYREWLGGAKDEWKPDGDTMRVSGNRVEIQNVHLDAYLKNHSDSQLKKAKEAYFDQEASKKGKAKL